jgi:hypothetical protein
VTAEVDTGKHHIAANAGKLRCPGAGCACVYEHYDLAQHLPRQSFDKLLAATTAYLEQTAIQTAAEQAKQELAREAAEDSVARARSHIIDSILTLKCPRCDKAFFAYFDGCFALYCCDAQGNGCRAAFCGYCLKECDKQSVHKHVAKCEHNTAARRDVWGKRADFDAAQRRRQQRLVVKYLDTLPAALRSKYALPLTKTYAAVV